MSIDGSEPKPDDEPGLTINRRTLRRMVVVAAAVLVVVGVGAFVTGRSTGHLTTAAARSDSRKQTTSTTTTNAPATTTTTPAASRTTITTSPSPSQWSPLTAYVDVSVSVLWTSPTSPSKEASGIDTPALANPVTMLKWQTNMTTTDRLKLTDDTLTQTEAILGNKVYIFGEGTYNGADWDEIAVAGQPTPKNSLGYPGWVPAVQLTQTPAPGFGSLLTQPFALVNGAPLVTLYNTAHLVAPFMRISYDTFLPLIQRQGTAIEVQTPTQGSKWLSDSTSTIYNSYPNIPAPTGKQMAKDAEMFEGGTYIWGGRSGFGSDCSGLTSMLYQANGITIDRDANAQAIAGLNHGDPEVQPTDPAGLKPGDVLFYATGNGTEAETIYHDAIYAGTGEMVEAYGAGVPIRITPVRDRTTPSTINGPTYWGAIQFLPTSAVTT